MPDSPTGPPRPQAPRGHEPNCRHAIFAGTAYAAKWPADPARCQYCRARAAS